MACRIKAFSGIAPGNFSSRVRRYESGSTNEEDGLLYMRSKGGGGIDPRDRENDGSCSVHCTEINIGKNLTRNQDSVQFPKMCHVNHEPDIVSSFQIHGSGHVIHLRRIEHNNFFGFPKNTTHLFMAHFICFGFCFVSQTVGPVTWQSDRNGPDFPPNAIHLRRT